MDNISGFLWQDFDVTTSTNDEARTALQNGHLCRAVYTACTQTAGRGRRGRQWVSERGNLFMSLTFQMPIHRLGQFVILSGLAVAQTIESFAPDASIEVKWPNDVLVGGQKISGILFEHGQDDWWIMGIGINIVSSPEKNMLYPTINLHSLNDKVDRIAVLKRFIGIFEQWTDRLQNGGFDLIRQSWLDKAYKLGKKILIKQEDQTTEGVFESIDSNGGLILKTENERKVVLVGDVFDVKENNDK